MSGQEYGPENDPMLVRAAQRGDMVAFEELVFGIGTRYLLAP